MIYEDDELELDIHFCREALMNNTSSVKREQYEIDNGLFTLEQIELEYLSQHLDVDYVNARAVLDYHVEQGLLSFFFGATGPVYFKTPLSKKKEQAYTQLKLKDYIFSELEKMEPGDFKLLRSKTLNNQSSPGSIKTYVSAYNTQTSESVATHIDGDKLWAFLPPKID